MSTSTVPITPLKERNKPEFSTGVAINEVKCNMAKNKSTLVDVIDTPITKLMKDISPSGGRRNSLRYNINEFNFLLNQNIKDCTFQEIENTIVSSPCSIVNQRNNQNRKRKRSVLASLPRKNRNKGKIFITVKAGEDISGNKIEWRPEDIVKLKRDFKMQRDSGRTNIEALLSLSQSFPGLGIRDIAYKLKESFYAA